MVVFSAVRMGMHNHDSVHHMGVVEQCDSSEMQNKQYRKEETEKSNMFPFVCHPGILRRCFEMLRQYNRYLSGRKITKLLFFRQIDSAVYSGFLVFQQ